MIPKHVAIVMDGAGRWAVERGKSRSEGQAEGIATAERVIEAACDSGVQFLTLYTFSMVSWERPREEVASLLKMVADFATRIKGSCQNRGIRVRTIGDVDELRSEARKAVESLQSATTDGDGMTLTLAVSYGGQSDVAQAARAIAAKARAGLLLPEDVDERTFHREMTSKDLPPVDLYIRTGGEAQLNDFLLYESAQAEVRFLPIMWPEFDRAAFQRTLTGYSEARERLAKRSRPPPG